MKALLIAIALLLATLVAFSEPTDRAEHDSYCELVAMWEADRARGVDAHDRAGHPNFNRVECE